MLGNKRKLKRSIETILKDTITVLVFCEQNPELRYKVPVLEQRIKVLEKSIKWAQNAHSIGEILDYLKNFDGLIHEEVCEFITTENAQIGGIMNADQQNLYTNALNGNNQIRSRKLSKSPHEIDDDPSDKTQEILRCQYILTVLISEGYLEVEDWKRPTEEYALLLSKDVFDYVSKNEFETLKQHNMITLSPYQRQKGSQIYMISEKGRSMFQQSALTMA